MNRWLHYAGLGCLFLTLQACQTFNGIQSAQINEGIRNEKPGNYWIGRRYFKKDYRFWGYVRAPGQPWSTAKLVMINEQRKLLPDREANDIGGDNNYEYILYGSFSGQNVYEPPSNRFLPEFVLTDYRVISTNPPAILTPGGQGANPFSTTIEAPR